MSWDNIFKKFGMGYMYKTIFYRLDWRKPKQESVNDFLELNILDAKKQKKVPRFKGTQDEKVYKIFKWVHDNIDYVTDQSRFKVAEKWQCVYETLAYGTGDCEDGAILIYSLAIAQGVNPAQIRLVTGNVTEGGHCWVEYMSDEFFPIWYTMDWCYKPQTETFKYRVPKSSDYLTEWWSISTF